MPDKRIEATLDSSKVVHTPGPWIVWQQRSDNSINVSAEKGRAFVCEVGKIAGEEYNDENVRADANLIAAAPALFAQLDLLVKSIERCAKDESITLTDIIKLPAFRSCKAVIAELNQPTELIEDVVPAYNKADGARHA